MGPSRPLATALLVASLAVAGCSSPPAPTTAAAPSHRPPRPAPNPPPPHPRGP
jgi:hypothetical protein